MRLTDVRKLTIKNQARVHFQLRNGMECVVTEHGISKVAGLSGPPDFNLEEEFAQCATFLLEPVPTDKQKSKTRQLSRAELETMTGALSQVAPAAHDHED
jgi:hypothetical protein